MRACWFGRWVAACCALAACTGVKPINTPWPAAEATAKPSVNALAPNPYKATRGNARKGGTSISGKEALTQRDVQGCTLVSADAAELACVLHRVGGRTATTRWQFFSVDNGAMVASYTVYTGALHSDATVAGGVDQSEAARVNERLKLGRFGRVDEVVRDASQLRRMVIVDGGRATVRWQGRSAVTALLPMVQEAPTVEPQRWQRCCQWRPLSATVLSEHLALVLRQACRLSGDDSERQSGCFVEHYRAPARGPDTAVVIVPKP